MLEKIKQAVNANPKAKLVHLYFAGHGGAPQDPGKPSALNAGAWDTGKYEKVDIGEVLDAWRETKLPHQKLFILADSCYSGNQILRLKKLVAELPEEKRKSLNLSFQSAGDVNQTVLEEKGFTHGGHKKNGGRETQYWLEKQKGEKRVNWTSRTRRPQDYHSDTSLRKVLEKNFSVKTHAYIPGKNLKNKTAFDEGEEVFWVPDVDEGGEVIKEQCHVQKIYCSPLSKLPMDYEVRFADGSTKRVEQSVLIDKVGLERTKGRGSSPGIKAAKPNRHTGDGAWDDFAEPANLLPQDEEPMPAGEDNCGLSWNAYRSTHKSAGMTREQMSKGYQAQKQQQQQAPATSPEPPSTAHRRLAEVEKLVAHGKVKPEVLEKLKKLHGPPDVSCNWNAYRSAHKGTGMTPEQMSEGYQAQKQQQAAAGGFICPVCFENLQSASSLTDHFDTAHGHDSGQTKGKGRAVASKAPGQWLRRASSTAKTIMASSVKTVAAGSVLAVGTVGTGIAHGVTGTAYGVAEGASRAFGHSDTADIVLEKAPSTVPAKFGRGLGSVIGAAAGDIASGIGGIGYGIARGAKAATGRAASSGENETGLSWNEYRSAHKGSGMTLKEMSASYQVQKKGRSSSVGSKVGHAFGTAVGAVAGTAVHAGVGIAYGIGAGAAAAIGKDDKSDHFTNSAPSTVGAKAGLAVGGLVGFVATGAARCAGAVVEAVAAPAQYESAPRCKDGTLDMRYAANRGRDKCEYEDGAPAPAGFGAPAPAPFGAPAPAFGGFGAAPAPAPTSLFGGAAPTTAFGGAAASPFGAPATPAFGTPAPAFGTPASTGFGGGTPSMFGSPKPAFGAPSPAPAFGSPFAPAGGGFGSTGSASGGGTGNPRYAETRDNTPNSGNMRFVAITAMNNYAGKSYEELRAEDYAKGNKGGGAGGAFGAPATTPFGAPAASTPFGTSAASTPFGAPAASAFGAAAPAFGAPTPGAFGSPAPAFGGFGAPAPAPFGALAPAPAFGAAPAPATPFSFGGAPAPAPATPFSFGGTPAQAPGGFGSPAPAFGAPAPAFGAAAPAFGAAAPAFGAPAPTPAFSFAGAPAPAPFGSPAPAPTPFGFGGAPAPAPGGAFSFSTPAAAPSFGAAAPKPFGSLAAAPAPFSFAAGAAPAFGAAAPKPFSMTTPGAPSMFGATAPAFGAGAPAPSMFGAGLGASTFGAPATSAYASAYAAPAPAAPPVPMPTYGHLPSFALTATAPVAVGNTLAGASSSAPAFGANAPSTVSTLTKGNDTCWKSHLPRGVALVKPRHATFKKTETSAKEQAKKVAAMPSSALFQQVNPDLFKQRKTKSLIMPRRAVNNDEDDFDPDVRPICNQAHNAIEPGGAAPVAGDTPTAAISPPVPSTNQQNVAAAKPGDLYSEPIDLRETELPRLSALQVQQGYYMKPSPEELKARFAEEQGNNPAIVSDFTIGRRGYGSIRWVGQTDVRGLDVDKFVRIEHIDVLVYDPDELEKYGLVEPPQGQKLNKPAVITFEGLGRNEKIQRKLARDPAFLERRSEKMDAKYINYDAANGTWEIQCKHFSAIDR
jgi:nuclear pore complex protein Nup98-Nup96